MVTMRNCSERRQASRAPAVDRAAQRTATRQPVRAADAARTWRLAGGMDTV
jgi:hypothetical protein